MFLQRRCKGEVDEINHAIHVRLKSLHVSERNIFAAVCIVDVIPYLEGIKPKVEVESPSVVNDKFHRSVHLYVQRWYQNLFSCRGIQIQLRVDRLACSNKSFVIPKSGNAKSASTITTRSLDKISGSMPRLISADLCRSSPLSELGRFTA